MKSLKFKDLNFTIEKKNRFPAKQWNDIESGIQPKKKEL